MEEEVEEEEGKEEEGKEGEGEEEEGEGEKEEGDEEEEGWEEEEEHEDECTQELSRRRLDVPCLLQLANDLARGVNRLVLVKLVKPELQVLDRLRQPEGVEPGVAGQRAVKVSRRRCSGPSLHGAFLFVSGLIEFIGAAGLWLPLRCAMRTGPGDGYTTQHACAPAASRVRRNVAILRQRRSPAHQPVPTQPSIRCAKKHTTDSRS